MAADLKQFQEQLDLGIVSGMKSTAGRCYNLILARPCVMDPRLQFLLDQSLDDWRRWAAWRPNSVRLLNWADRLDDGSPGSFGSLLALEGPDNDSRNGQYRDALWHRLIRRRGLIPWLETKGYTPAVCLITGDTEELQASFITDLLDAAALAGCTKYKPLLEYLIARDGLDTQPITSWQAIRGLLQPDFVALLLPGTLPPDADQILTAGLRDMARDVTSAARRPLAKEVVRCVMTVTALLLQAFYQCLWDKTDWLETGRKLWRLRSTIAEAGWLHSHLGPNFVQNCKSQTLERNLTALHDLQVLIESRLSSFTRSLVAYIGPYVAEGRCILDETTALVKQLHTLWLCSPSPSFQIREVAVAITALDFISQEVRSGCVKSLPRLSAIAAQTLGHGLSSIVEAQPMAIVSLTDCIVALPPSCHGSGCWNALLLSIIDHFGFTVLDFELTTLGFATYSSWIETLFKQIGGAMDQLEEMCGWFKALKQYEAAIVALEAFLDSEISLTSILVRCPESDREDHLEILNCLHEQVDNGRREFMQQLYLTMGSTDLATVSKAVASVHVLSDAGFATCQDLMKSCSESREAASVRLCIWLRTTMVDTDTENALLSLGQVLKLGFDRDTVLPSSLFETAGKYYGKRVARLVAITQMLEGDRMVLKRSKPKAIRSMMDDLGLE